jgi:predicted DNA-binding ribbon-helix-helix protein
VNEKLLRIYLQDHHAGSAAGLELARRTRGSNKGNEYGEAMAKIADEIAADQKALEGVMDDLGFGTDRIKDIGAWALEKAGRFKLNGQITGYSPLSRVVELEGLLTGITAKIALWVALLQIAAEDPRLDAARIERLRERGESQRTTVEELRQRAVREAFAG